MKQTVIIFLLAVLFGNAVDAQQVYTSSGRSGYHKKTKKKGYDPDKLILGTGINAFVGNGAAGFLISPIVGYRVNDRFSAGIGLGYQYYQTLDPDLSTVGQSYYIYDHIVTPSLWAKFFVWEQLFASASYENNIIFDKRGQGLYDQYGNPYIVQRNSMLNSNCLLLGGGIKQPMGGRFSATIELLFDLLKEQNSPYSAEPFVVRVGFCLGL
jgi:hypothetical protein